MIRDITTCSKDNAALLGIDMTSKILGVRANTYVCRDPASLYYDHLRCRNGIGFHVNQLRARTMIPVDNPMIINFREPTPHHLPCNNTRYCNEFAALCISTGPVDCNEVKCRNKCKEQILSLHPRAIIRYKATCSEKPTLHTAVK